MDGFLKSIFLLAFNGFLRFGEVVVKSKCSEGTVIQREVVSFVYLKQYTFVRCHFIAKFQNKKEKKTLFQIYLRASTKSDMWPVLALHNYLETFGHISGTLLQFMEGYPVS